MDKIELRKKVLKKYLEVLPLAMGGPGSGPNPGGGKEGSGGEGDKDHLDPKTWQELSPQERTKPGLPAGKDRNGNEIKNGDKVVVKDATMRKPTAATVSYKNPVTNTVYVKVAGQDTPVKDWEVAKGDKWN